MSHVLTSITNLIISIISNLGYAGVGFLMALQTAAVPIPSEVILPFAGFLVSSGRFNLFILSLVGGLGSCVGSSIAYFIGYKGGRPLVEKYGKYLLISHNDLNRSEKFFAKFGTVAIFIGQLLPIVRSFIGFVAGIAEENFKKFIISVFIGSFLWSLLLGYIGLKLGEHWGDLHGKFQKFDVVIVVLLVIFISVWAWRHIRQEKV